MTVEYADQTLVNAFLSDTELALSLTFTSTESLGTGYAQLQIVLPAIKLNGELPKANGTDLVTAAVDFDVLDNLTATQPIWLVLGNLGRRALTMGKESRRRLRRRSRLRARHRPGQGVRQEALHGPPPRSAQSRRGRGGGLPRKVKKAPYKLAKTRRFRIIRGQKVVESDTIQHGKHELRQHIAKGIKSASPPAPVRDASEYSSPPADPTRHRNCSRSSGTSRKASGIPYSPTPNRAATSGPGRSNTDVPTSGSVISSKQPAINRDIKKLLDRTSPKSHYPRSNPTRRRHEDQDRRRRIRRGRDRQTQPV